MSSCADAVENFLKVYEKWKMEEEVWKAELKKAHDEYNKAQSIQSKLIRFDSVYVPSSDNKSAYNCNTAHLKFIGERACMLKDLAIKRCQCQKLDRKHLPETCDPYTLFNSIPKTFNKNDKDDNFRKWCKANWLDWESTKNYSIAENLPEKDSMWPIVKSSYQAKIDQIYSKRPSPPSNVNFSCQQCSTSFDVGDISASNLNEIEQYLNCVLQTETSNSKNNPNSTSNNSTNSTSNNSTNSTSNKTNSNVKLNSTNNSNSTKNSNSNSNININSKVTTNTKINTNTNSPDLNNLLFGGGTILFFLIAFGIYKSK